MRRMILAEETAESKAWREQIENTAAFKAYFSMVGREIGYGDDTVIVTLGDAYACGERELLWLEDAVDNYFAGLAEAETKRLREHDPAASRERLTAYVASYSQVAVNQKASCPDKYDVISSAEIKDEAGAIKRYGSAGEALAAGAERLAHGTVRSRQGQGATLIAPDPQGHLWAVSAVRIPAD